MRNRKGILRQKQGGLNLQFTGTRRLWVGMTAKRSIGRWPRYLPTNCETRLGLRTITGGSSRFIRTVRGLTRHELHCTGYRQAGRLSRHLRIGPESRLRPSCRQLSRQRPRQKKRRRAKFGPTSCRRATRSNRYPRSSFKLLRGGRIFWTRTRISCPIRRH